METVTFELAAEELDQRFIESIRTLFRGNKIVITVASKTHRRPSEFKNLVDTNRKDRVSYHIPADVFVALTDRVFEDETFDIMSEFPKIQNGRTMRELKFKNKAFEQLGDWFEDDKKTAIRILRILRECQRTPYEGIGKPEPLKGKLQGLWSRRIDEKHRLVYEVTNELIFVHSLLGHYEN